MRQVEEAPIAPSVLVLTIVLNGMPFLTHHRAVLEAVAPWQWHIVEGVAVGRADASRPYSSEPLTAFEKNGLSVDGTTEYIDALAAGDARVKVHRKPGGYWRDKIEMINAALAAMP